MNKSLFLLLGIIPCGEILGLPIKMHYLSTPTFFGTDFLQKGKKGETRKLG